MNHQENCECIVCKEGFQGLKNRQNEAMEKHGFYSHYVSDDDYPLGVNAHTHGVLESFNHLDFQIVVPLPQQVMFNLFWNLVDRVKEGEQFLDGMVLKGIAGHDYTVKLVTAVECGREVLRVILPDVDGNYEESLMEGNLARQYEKLET